MARHTIRICCRSPTGVMAPADVRSDVSHTSPDALLALARGFQESRVLLTGAELNLFTLLSKEALTAEAIAARLGADLRALTIELDALAAMELLVKADGTYRTAPDAACLSADAPDSIHPMLLHAAALWDRWTKLTRRIGGTPLPERPPRRRPARSSARCTSCPRRRPSASWRPPASAARAASWTSAAGPGPTRRRFSAPCPGSRRRSSTCRPSSRSPASGCRRPDFSSRVTLVAGDFENDELPAGHDLAWLSAIIHQNGPAQNDALYARIFRALVPGGRLVIRDHVMEPDRTRPRAGALFAVNMLVGTAQGGTYTFDEISAGLERAGFIRVRQLRAGERMDASWRRSGREANVET